RAARARGREARDELLTAALRVFARRGYRQAGVDEIAAEAGYSKGALYWHFSGKEELLEALLEERIDAPMRDRFALLASAPPERDMSVEATRAFAQQVGHSTGRPAARGDAPRARVLEPRDPRSRAPRPLRRAPDGASPRPCRRDGGPGAPPRDTRADDGCGGRRSHRDEHHRRPRGRRADRPGLRAPGAPRRGPRARLRR